MVRLSFVRNLPVCWPVWPCVTFTSRVARCRPVAYFSSHRSLVPILSSSVPYRSLVVVAPHRSCVPARTRYDLFLFSIYPSTAATHNLPTLLHTTLYSRCHCPHLIQVSCVPFILILRVYDIPINCEHGSWHLLRLLNIACIRLCSFVVNRGLKHRCSLKWFITVLFLDWVSCTRHLGLK